MVADQDADTATGGDIAFLGLDIDDAGGAQTVLCRQRASHEVDLLDKTGIDRLPESGNAFRQLHAIDAILHIAVVVAHMQRARGL